MLPLCYPRDMLDNIPNGNPSLKSPARIGLYPPRTKPP